MLGSNIISFTLQREDLGAEGVEFVLHLLSDEDLISLYDLGQSSPHELTLGIELELRLEAHFLIIIPEQSSTVRVSQSPIITKNPHFGS